MKQTVAAIAIILSLGLAQQRAYAQTAVAVPLGAAVVIIGGISYYVWINSQGNEESTPVPMLEDPEATSTEEWDYIWADSYAQAAEKCQTLVNSFGGIYVKVVQKSGGNRYECHWRSQ